MPDLTPAEQARADMIRRAEVLVALFPPGKNRLIDRHIMYTFLLAQTPQSVWEGYRENGYTQWEAVQMEMSYA